MAITKETKIVKTEIVGDYKAIQIAEDIIYKELKEADIEWGGKYNSRPDGDKRLAGIVRDACKKVR